MEGSVPSRGTIDQLSKQRWKYDGIMPSERKHVLKLMPVTRNHINCYLINMLYSSKLRMDDTETDPNMFCGMFASIISEAAAVKL